MDSVRMVTLQKFVSIARLGGLSPTGERKFQALHWSGAMLALSGVVSVLFVTSVGAGDVADVVALRIFAYVCWLYGGLGLWRMLRPDAMEGYALARLRGLRVEPLWGKAGTLFLRLNTGMLLAGLPGVLLAVLLGDVFPDFWGGAGLVLSCIAYVVALSAFLSGVGAGCHGWSARWARWAAAAVLLGPFLLSLWVGPFPNPLGTAVQVFGWLLSQGGEL